MKRLYDYDETKLRNLIDYLKEKGEKDFFEASQSAGCSYRGSLIIVTHSEKDIMLLAENNDVFSELEKILNLTPIQNP